MEETLLLTTEQMESLLCKYCESSNYFNKLMELMLNTLMKLERTLFLQDRDKTANKCNGYRPLQVFGNGKVLELRVPRDRLSEFKPVILSLYRSQEDVYRQVVFNLYSKGLTTRDISDVMNSIYGDNYSKSKISYISQSFYTHLESWRNRPLDKHYKAFYIDGMMVKLMRDNTYQNECFYIILGLKEDNTREIISIVNYPTESSSSWELIFDDIKRRGVERVGIIVSDSLSGIDNSICKKFPMASHQKCCVHLMRNLMTHVRREDKSLISSDFKYVLDISNASHTQEAAVTRFNEFKEKWRIKYRHLGRYLDGLNIMPYLTFLNYDYRIRNMLYTTNWIERFNKQARRTLKIRGSMPNDESVLALITSVAKDMSEGTYSFPLHIFSYEMRL